MDAAALDTIEVTVGASSRIGLTAALAVMIFSVSLTLKPGDFAFLGRQPKMFFGGLSTQIIALPLMSIGLAHLLAPTPSVAFGMIVVACCPGGNVSNLMVLMARGNAAYSVSLTAASSALAFLVTPIAIFGWASLYPPTAALIRTVEIEALPFILQTGMALGVPLAAGMLLSTFFPAIARRIQPVFYAMAIAILVLLVTVGLVSNWELILASSDVIAPVAIIHNAAAFGLGALAGRLLSIAAPSRRALTFEIGIQNAGLGLVILLTQFPALGGAAAVTGFWSIWHLFAGLFLAGAFRLWDRYSAIRV